MIWLSIAWRNLRRQGRRSLITASAMAVSVGLCMSSFALNDGMYAEIFHVMVEQQIGHVQVTHPDYPGKQSLYDTLHDATAMVTTISAEPHVTAVAPRLEGFGLLGGAERSAGARVVGIDPELERRATPVWERMRAGSYLAPGDSGTILLGWKLAEDLGVDVGGEVVVVTQAADGSLGNALYQVAGTYKSGDSAMDRAGAYVTLADLQSLLVLPDQAHEITVLTDDPDALAPIVAAIAADLPHTLVRPWQEVSPQSAQMLAMQDVATFIVLGIVFAVASFGVINTMLVSVFERTTELGVMRALGVSPGQLVRLVVLESVLLGALSAGVGLVLGGALDAYLVFHGYDMSGSIEGGFDFQGVMLDPVLKGTVRVEPIVLTVVTLVAVSALAAVWPATRAAWIRPVDAIRAE